MKSYTNIVIKNRDLRELFLIILFIVVASSTKSAELAAVAREYIKCRGDSRVIVKNQGHAHAPSVIEISDLPVSRLGPSKPRVIGDNQTLYGDRVVFTRHFKQESKMQVKVLFGWPRKKLVASRRYG